jgi:cell division protein FtsB
VGKTGYADLDVCPFSNRQGFMSAPLQSQRLVLFALIVFCLLFLVGYASRLAEQARLQAEIAGWEARITQAQQEQALLQVQLEHVQSDAFVHERARNELGLVLPGDELIIRLEQQPALLASAPATGEPAVRPTDKPNWRQWLDLFWPTAIEKSAR